MNHSQKTHNLIIIGSGPAGLTAAIYAARAGLTPVVIASAVNTGGELMKTTEVENFPGFENGVLGPDLITKMQTQAEKFGAEFIYDDVTQANLSSKLLTLSSGQTLSAKAIIIATGAENKTLGLAREKELTGYGISYCATCDGFFFKDKAIGVVGGGDSAVEEALFLTRFASKVYLIHRRDSYKASQIMQKRLKENPKIDEILNSEVIELIGEKALNSIKVKNNKTGDIQTLSLDGLFIAIGHTPRSSLFKNQITIGESGIIETYKKSSLTSLEGIFAAGDVVDNIYAQAITAAASGCIAALDAQNYLASL